MIPVYESVLECVNGRDVIVTQKKYTDDNGIPQVAIGVSEVNYFRTLSPGESITAEEFKAWLDEDYPPL